MSPTLQAVVTVAPPDRRDGVLPRLFGCTEGALYLLWLPPRALGGAPVLLHPSPARARADDGPRHCPVYLVRRASRAVPQAVEPPPLEQRSLGETSVSA